MIGRAALAMVGLLAVMAVAAALAIARFDPGFDPSGSRLEPRPAPAPEVSPGAIALSPGQGLPDIYEAMVRVGIEEECGEGTAGPLVQGIGAAPPLGSWACAMLTNRGPERGIWRIALPSAGAPGAVFYDTRGGVDTPAILTAGIDTPIAGREAGMRRHVSEPIVLAPGETTEIEVQILNPGIETTGDAALMPERDLNAELAAEAVLQEGFQGAALIFALYFAVYGLILRSRPALWYAAFFAANAVELAAGTGQIGYWLLPDAPRMAALVELAVYLAMVVTYLGFVASFLRPGLPGIRLGWLVWGGALALPLLLLAVFGLRMAGLPAAGMVATFAFQGLPAAVAVVGVALGLLAIARGVNGSAIFTLGAAVFLGYQILGPLNPLGWDPLARQAAQAAGQMIDGAIFAAALIVRTLALRGERDAALRAELAATREAADLNARLLAARGDADDARALADARRARLASTSHDLRQPLQSLRLALEEARTSAPALGETLETSLGYLDGVLGSALEETRPGEGQAGAGPAGEGPEAVPVQLVLDNAVRMFAAEAAEKGLSLRAAPTSLAARADPVALIRAVANLTANAVRYTGQGGVLLGARPHGDTVRIEVHDTGPGLTEAETARVLRPYERGATGAGTGLGLAGTAELVRAQGGALAVRSRPGKGSTFAMEGLGRA